MVNWSGGAGGAASGAAIGTTILPGWGTAIGAGIGGIAGLFGGGGGGPSADSRRRYNELGRQLDGDIAGLRRRANGEDSLSAEALRQGYQQVQAGQASMAAGASPQNSTIAALTASRNAMTAGAGLSGQMATAGIQERQAAQDALIQAMLRRQQLEQGGAQTLDAQQPNWIDRFGPAIRDAATAYAAQRGRGQQPQPAGDPRYGRDYGAGALNFGTPTPRGY